MRTYGQYCPIARAAEIVAERWTPLIIRNIHAGCGTYSEILAGAPGLSHTLLTQRLRHLTKVGIVSVRPKASGPGVRYALTDAGRDLWPVLSALGTWGEQWVELRDEHANPRFLLWTWSTTYLAHANLPDRRVVIRFELRRPAGHRAHHLAAGQPHRRRSVHEAPWLRGRPRGGHHRCHPRPVAHQADRVGRRHPLRQDPRYRPSDTRHGAADLEPTSAITVAAARHRPVNQRTSAGIALHGVAPRQLPRPAANGAAGAANRGTESTLLGRSQPGSARACFWPGVKPKSVSAAARTSSVTSAGISGPVFWPP